MVLLQNIKWVWINLFILLIFLPLWGCDKKQSMEIGATTLKKDTTWQGNVLVKGDILVPPGITLTIEPGTIIKFKRIDEKSDQNLFGVDTPYYPEAELIIQGRLLAVGTAKKQIVFSSAEIDARPADWGAINFLGSQEKNTLKHVKILYAYNGVHSHGSNVEVSSSEFAKNGVGISFKMEEETPGVPWFGKISTFTISHNRFYNNKGGIGFRNSKAKISYNIIEDNKFFGIFPKEKAEAVISYNQITGNKKGIYLYQTQLVQIENNNIYDNASYNIGVAEAQDFDVSATNNWFGTINKEKINALIFDKKDDPDLGEVLYEPFLNKPVPRPTH